MLFASILPQGVIPSEPDMWLWLGDAYYADEPVCNSCSWAEVRDGAQPPPLPYQAYCLPKRALAVAPRLPQLGAVSQSVCMLLACACCL